MKSMFIGCLLISIFLVSGCLDGQTDVTSVAKTLPQVEAFLADHPNADIKVTLWSENAVSENINQIRNECEAPIEIKSYYKITMVEGSENVIVWLDKKTNEAVCIIRDGSDTSSTDKDNTDYIENTPQDESEEDTYSEEIFDRLDSTVNWVDAEYTAEDEELTIYLKNVGSTNIPIDSSTTWLLTDSSNSNVCHEQWNTLCSEGCGNKLLSSETRKIVLDLSGTACDISAYSDNTLMRATIFFGGKATTSGTFEKTGEIAEDNTDDECNEYCQTYQDTEGECGATVGEMVGAAYCSGNVQCVCLPQNCVTDANCKTHFICEGSQCIRPDCDYACKTFYDFGGGECGVDSGSDVGSAYCGHSFEQCMCYAVTEHNIAGSGDTVKVDYTLIVNNEIVDSTNTGLFEFTIDSGQTIIGFNNAVIGMKIGETKSVILTGSDAYTSGPLAGEDLYFTITLRDIN